MKLLQKSLLGLITACMIMAFGGIVPAGAASGGSGEMLKVSIPYTQIYDADSTRTDDTFKYQIVPVNGAPAPQDSVNGVYYFNVKAKPDGQKVTGKVNLMIPFAKVGEYKYNVSSADTAKIEGMKYDETVYTAHVYIGNADNGYAVTGVTLTAKGSSGKKESLLFQPSYSAKAAADKERTASSPDGNGQVTDVDRDQDQNRKRNQNQTTDGAPAQNRNVNNDGAVNDDTDATEEPSALETIKDSVLPKADPNRDYWSLINLLALIMIVSMCIILFARYMGRVDTDADEFIIRRGGKLRLLGFVPAAVALVVFLSTEDFGNKMGMTDEWTPFMIIALVVEAGICALVYKAYDRQIKDASA